MFYASYHRYNTLRIYTVLRFRYINFFSRTTIVTHYKSMSILIFLLHINEVYIHNNIMLMCKMLYRQLCNFTYVRMYVRSYIPYNYYAHTYIRMYLHNKWSYLRVLQSLPFHPEIQVHWFGPVQFPPLWQPSGQCSTKVHTHTIYTCKLMHTTKKEKLAP